MYFDVKYVDIILYIVALLENVDTKFSHVCYIVTRLFTNLSWQRNYYYNKN